MSFYQQDWLMRQIEGLSAFLAFVLLGRREGGPHQEETGEVLEQGDTLPPALEALVAAGELGRAEDLVFDALEEGEPRALETAVGFYARLNTLTDRELEAGDFSREEILSGLREMCRRQGVQDDLFFPHS